MKRIDPAEYYRHMMTEIEVLEILEPDPDALDDFANKLLLKAKQMKGEANA